MRYTGILEFTDKIRDAFANGTSTEFGDNYFVIQPMFETGDERYSWLNRLVAVAEGRLLEGGMHYKVFECAPGD